MTWQIAFFGNALLSDRAGEPVLLAGRRADALLARLAIEPGQSVSSRALVELLWPEREHASGGGALRQAVHLIRQATEPGMICTRHGQVALNASIVQTDLQQLRADKTMLAIARDLRSRAAGPTFLANIKKAGPAFEDWRARAQSQAVSLASSALGHLATHDRRAADFAGASAAARAGIALEPLAEAPVRSLVETLIAMGEPAAANSEVRAFARRLARHGGASPSPGLRALVDRRQPLTVSATERGGEVILAAIALAAVTRGDRAAADAIAECLEALGGCDVKQRQATVSAFFGGRGLRASMVAATVDAARAVGRLDAHVHIGLAMARIWRRDDGPARLRETDRARAIALAATAGAGEIVCEPALQALSGAEFLPVGPRRNITLNPKAGPEPSHQRPFVGRLAERRQMAVACDCVRSDGIARIVAVCGPPGIGKSRLISEVLAERQDLKVVRAQPAFAANGTLDLLAPLLTASPAGTAAGKRHPAPHRQGSAEDQVVALIGSCPDPQLIVIEDAERLGAGEAKAVVRLIERLTDRPVLWLFGARIHNAERLDFLSPLVGVVPITELMLAPLSDGEARELSQTYDMPAAVRRECLARAAGNPLFLHQLLLHRTEGARGLPASIEEAIFSRFESLGSAPMAALRLAATLGDAAPVKAILDIGDVAAEVLDALETRRLIRRDNALVSIEHGLIRDAVLAVTPASALAQLHRRAAVWFDGRDPERFARHLHAAHDPRAAPAMLQAATCALAARRYGAAADLGAGGSSVAKSGRLKAALKLVEGNALVALGRLSDAEAAFDGARDATLDNALRAEALIGAANVERLRDRTAAGLAFLDDAEGLLDAQDDTAFSRLLVTRGRLLFAAGANNESRQTYLAALARAPAAGQQELAIDALSGLADAAYAEGDMASADRYAAAAIDECRACGSGVQETVQWSFRSHVMVYTGALGAARAVAQRTATEASAACDWRAEINARLAIASAAFCQNDLDICSAQADRVAALAARSGARRFDLVAGLYRTRVAIARGERQHAERLLETLRPPLDETNHKIHGPQWQILATFVAPTRPQLADAVALAETMLEDGPVAHNALRVLPVAALLWWSLGEPQRSLDAVANLRRSVVSGEPNWATMMATAIESLLTGRPEANAVERAGSQGFQRLADVLENPTGPIDRLLVC